MAKAIEETFSIELNGQNFHITARNYNAHQFTWMRGIDSVDSHLTTEEMRRLGKHLIDSANKIDEDPDFKSLTNGR